MSSVYELTMSNFDGLNDPEKLVVRKRFVGKDTEYLTHTDYNCVFIHDYKNIHDITPETFTKVDTDYKRRVERLSNILAGHKSLLFVRLEQDPATPRIAYPGTERPHDEYTYLEMFADHMKSRGKDFYIIHLSQTREKGFDSDHNIITIKFNKQTPETIVSGDHIAAIVAAHKEFITSCF